MVVHALQKRIDDLQIGFKSWMSKQPPHVEIALTTVTSAVQGGLIGGLMGTLTGDVTAAMPATTAGLSAEAAANMQQMKALAGGPVVQARNFAVMTGVNAGISCAMRHARKGKEDVKNSMVAAFGSGAAFSLVSGVGAQNAVGTALSTGVAFALLQGAFFKIGQQFTQPPVDDKLYLNTKMMLVHLGLQKYEKNFRKGLLTDATLPLLNDSALRDVRIPPGPRLLILDQVRDKRQCSRAVAIS
eukprot:TRINITY_DN1191_c0_g1_i1.p1 TRINITY_DN1191_c0_g1~~TRINITY_DN1191_c0_g1_i1.p1  ORF type:complete len:243 (-),score=42.97 TRINITY_DN1191_c0_g1_i1:44-772(-)